MATLTERFQILLGIKGEGFSGLSGQVKSFAQGIQKDFANIKSAVAGYFTADVLKSLVQNGMAVVTETKAIAETWNVSTSAAQKYSIAAMKIGLDAGKLGAIFSKLAELRIQALEGPMGTRDVAFEKFSRFGISIDELRSLKEGSDLYERIRETVSKLERQEGFGLLTLLVGSRLAGKMQAMFRMEEEDYKLLSDEEIEKLFETAVELKLAARELSINAVQALGWILDQFKLVKDYFPGVSGDPGGVASQQRQDAMFQKAMGYWKKDGYKEISGSLAERKVGAEFLKRIGYGHPYDAWGMIGEPLETMRRGLGTMTTPALSRDEMDMFDAQFTAAQTGKTVEEVWRKNVKADKHTPRPLTREELLAEDKKKAFAKDPLRGVTPSTIEERLGASRDTYLEAQFKVSGVGKKREIIQDQMKALTEQKALLESKRDYAEAQAVTEKIIKLGGEFAELMRLPKSAFKAGEAAGRGQFIGGAALGIDPSLQIDQDIRALMDRAVNRHLPDLLTEIKKAVAHTPLGDLN